jgi:hypothetical protein
LGGAKLFTVGCGEWFLRLSLPPMNNFGGTISTQRAQSFSLLPPFPPVRRIFICVNLRQSAGNSGFGCGWPRWDLCVLLWQIPLCLRLCRSGRLCFLSSGGAALPPRKWFSIRSAISENCAFLPKFFSLFLSFVCSREIRFPMGVPMENS